MRTKKIFFGWLFRLILPVVICGVTTAESDSRREQLRQEAQASYAQVKQTLEAILEKVNLNQRPPERLIQEAAELLEANRRNVAVYESPQRANYMLLQSWVFYYQKDPVQNLNWAVRACREDPANGDAWISQTLFSFIHGRRPVEPQPPRPQPESRRRQPQPRGRQALEMPEETQPVYDASAPYGRPESLEFDLATLRRDFLRERFSQREFQTIDGKKIAVTADSNDAMCMLVWKNASGEAAAAVDPNKPGRGSQQHFPGEMAMPMDIPFGTPAASDNHSLKNQQAYFEVMKEVLSDKEEVRFFEMNVHPPAGIETALLKHQPVAPLVVAAHPQSGASPFVRMDVSVPFMAIVDHEGKVRYAGAADGFMPAFILTHLTGVEIDLEAFQAASDITDMPFDLMPGMGHEPAPGVSPAMPSEMPPDMMMYEPMPGAPPHDMMMPPMPQPAPQQQQPEPEPKYRQLPEHQQIEAERRVSVVRDFFMTAPRKRFITYKRGVDMCREIIRDYPDTLYAEQARHLLRQVPERQRATYNITDAELGL